MTRSPGWNSVTPGTDALDHAGELAAGRERKRRLGLVSAGDDQGIEKIQPDRRDLGDDFPRSRNRVGDIREHEIVGGAEALAENGFHGNCSHGAGDAAIAWPPRRTGRLRRMIGGRRAMYILAAAEAAAICLHIAEFPKLLHGVRLHLHIAATVTEVGR